MEAQAVNRYIGSSPRKMRLVIDLIRGKSIPEALHILHFSPKHASKVAEKVLRSAVSNLQNKDDAGRIEPEDIIVKRAFVDGGMQMKRISPAPMGRAYRIRKRSNHVTIIVAAKEALPKEEPKAKAAAKAAPKEVKKPAAAKGGKKTAPAAETK
ncbi:MAG TPA: 50S ribosomal protein L22 [Bacteroidota bacterium]|nr:50S ribosomal protein L22 [Bacteroidota bacterium]